MTEDLTLDVKDIVGTDKEQTNKDTTSKVVDTGFHLDLTLYDPRDVISGKGTGKRGTGERYGKYINCIKKQKIADFVKSGIARSKEGAVWLPLNELSKKCGMTLRLSTTGTGKADNSLIWGFRFAFWLEGIKISKATGKKGIILVRLELKTEHDTDDTLPESLQKLLPTREIETEGDEKVEPIQDVVTEVEPVTDEKVVTTGPVQETESKQLTMSEKRAISKESVTDEKVEPVQEVVQEAVQETVTEPAQEPTATKTKPKSRKR